MRILKLLTRWLPSIAFSFLTLPVWATSPVQSNYAILDGSADNFTLALSSSATPGDTIIIVLGFQDQNGSSFSPSQIIDANGTYQVVIDPAMTSFAGLSILYVPNCASGTHSTTITSSTASNFYGTAAIYEFPGLTTTPLDKHSSENTDAGGAGQTSQATGSTGTLSQASEFVITAMSWDDDPGVSVEGVLVPSGFTVDPNIPTSFQDTGNNIGLQVGWMDVSATTALNPSFTWASQPGMIETVAGVGTFKKAGGAPVTNGVLISNGHPVSSAGGIVYQ